MSSPVPLHHRHQFRAALFGHKAVEAAGVCLLLMVQGDLGAVTLAHLAIAALRTLGIPSRYVSGYLLTRPPPGQVKLKGADASHAWLSVWAPETGWVDFDPTNGIMPSMEHITVAYGRDYEDISPISGVLLGGGDQRMSVAVDVESFD